jgi:hypothetical protein
MLEDWVAFCVVQSVGFVACLRVVEPDTDSTSGGVALQDSELEAVGVVRDFAASETELFVFGNSPTVCCDSEPALLEMFQLVVAYLAEPAVAVGLKCSVVELLEVSLVLVAFVSWGLVS